LHRQAEILRLAIMPSLSGVVTSAAILGADYHNPGNRRKQTLIPSE
jgi:hypothetical protein